MNVILCGMPGSGKSYWGKKAAESLNLPFIDTDEWVMRICQQPCRTIVLEKGLDYFRQIENRVLEELLGTKDSIIATGGGILSSSSNIPLLKELGSILYLKVTPELLWERLMHKNPLPTYLDSQDKRGSFERLYKERFALYEQNAHGVIDVASEDVVETIKKWLKNG